jgi:hypothetical protein
MAQQAAYRTGHAVRQGFARHDDALGRYQRSHLLRVKAGGRVIRQRQVGLERGEMFGQRVQALEQVLHRAQALAFPLL